GAEADGVRSVCGQLIVRPAGNDCSAFGVVDLLGHRCIKPAETFGNAPLQASRHFRGDLPLSLTVYGPSLYWRRAAIADLHQQVVESGKHALEIGEFGAEKVGGIQRRERAALALPVPLRREWPDMEIEHMPGECIEVPALELPGGDVPGFVKQIIDAFERGGLDAVGVAEPLCSDAGDELDVQLRRGFAVGVVRLPQLVAPGRQERLIEQRAMVGQAITPALAVARGGWILFYRQ